MNFSYRLRTTSGTMWEREQRNHAIIKGNCVPIMVTPEELAQAVDHNGICLYRASALVDQLLNRANQEAIAKTLGVDV